MSKNINVLLIGSYPPPYGGISVHIERLYHHLLKKGNKCQILHTGSNRTLLNNNKDIFKIFEIFKLIKIKKTNPIVHIHVSALHNLLKIFLLSSFFNKQRKIITIHSGTFIKNLKKQSNLRYVLLKKVFKNFHYLIAVNAEQKKLLIDRLKINETKIVVIPAFIYPTASLKEFSKKDITLIKQTNKIKIVMSGYLLEFYGYELVLDYLENNEKYMGFFIFYGTNNEEYKKRIINRITNMKNIYYYCDLKPAGFNWLLKNSDIYVRNTDRDGDSVAIREAFYWGLSVCATNAVERPKGTKLFIFNNKSDFRIAIQDVINQPNNGKIDHEMNYANNIYELYKSLTY